MPQFGADTLPTVTSDRTRILHYAEERYPVGFIDLGFPGS